MFITFSRCKNIIKPILIFLLASLFITTLSSCSGNREDGPAVVKPTPTPSSQTPLETTNIYTLENPKPIPTPTKIYQPTKTDNPIAKAFLTTKELPGFTVSNPPDVYTGGPQLESEKTFYACNGPSAHQLAKGPVDGQLAGDHYYKLFAPNLQAITSSSYFPTKTGKEFVEYIKKSKTHERCLIEFMQRFKGNASNTNDLKQEIVSFENNLLITRLYSTDTPIKPGLNFYTFYTYSDTALLSFTVNVMGYNTPARAKLSEEMVAIISSAILEKIKLV